MTVRSHYTAYPWLRSQALSLLLTTGAALALGVLAQVRIPLPFTPVPVTLQVLGVLLLGGLLGPRLALVAVAEYLLLGLCGLPLFTGGSAGFAALLGPTGGYLLGFLPMTLLVGSGTQRLAGLPYAQKLTRSMLVSCAAVLVLYAVGWAWLAGYISLIKAVPTVTAWQVAFVQGVIPFIAVDLLKSAIAAATVALRD